MEKKTLTQFFTENGGDGEILLNSLQSSTENKKTKVTNSGPPKPTGPQGIQGETGAIGPQGEQGIQGETGAQGIQGEPGKNGEQGPQGIQGETGAQGIQGETGATSEVSISSESEALLVGNDGKGNFTLGPRGVTTEVVVTSGKSLITLSFVDGILVSVKI